MGTQGHYGVDKRAECSGRDRKRRSGGNSPSWISGCRRNQRARSKAPIKEKCRISDISMSSRTHGPSL